ncbi:MAG: hypothetical protein IIX77_06820 [Oscillospiraceae bacterium]|nr:hypothetical protein [Oscillospiraceae bacterium]
MPKFQKNNIMEWDVNDLAVDTLKLVELCDFQYDRNIEDVAEGIAAQVAEKPLIMLSGPSASGKTTTANLLAKKLTDMGVPAQVVSLDDFYLGPARCPRREDGTIDFETVFALDVVLCNRCLQQLLNEGEAVFPIYDFVTKERAKQTKTITLPKGGAVIVEGLHALNPILTSGIIGHYATVYTTAMDRYIGKHEILKTNDIRLIRRLVRDLKHRNIGAAETVDMWHDVCYGEAAYIKPYRSDCDYYVNSSFWYEPGLYTPYLQEVANTTPYPQRGRVEKLLEKLEPFVPVDVSFVKKDAMIREFIGE